MINLFSTLNHFPWQLHAATRSNPFGGVPFADSSSSKLPHPRYKEPPMQRSIVSPVWIVIAFLFFDVATAHAGSGVQVTVDGAANLISKDVGNDRWAMTYNLADKTATGNVFRSDGGDPAFVWCETTAEGGGTATLHCFGANRCESAPCAGSDWSSLGTVDLPLQFFFPPGSVATPIPQPTTTPRPTSTPIATDSLSALIGTWNFTYTIISTFTDTYRLQSIQTGSTGKRLLVGQNQLDEPVFAARIQEISPGASLPFEFELLDNRTLLCEFHVFNRTGETSVDGQAFVMFTDAEGNCDADTAQEFSMSGSRVSTAADAMSMRLLARSLSDVRMSRDSAVIAELDALRQSGAMPAAAAETTKEIRSAVRALLGVAR